MDLSKIFLKDACPTSIGGQALMEGVMMRGVDRTAVAVRLPDDRIKIMTKMNKAPNKLMKVPIIRGVVAFITSLVTGTRMLMYSAEMIEEHLPEDEEEEPGKIENWLTNKFGEKAVWNILIYISVTIALAVSVGVFMLLPTVLMDLLSNVIDNHILLNLIEGVFRLLLFILYIVLITKMEDIKTVFRYHGAEHKTIHCFENNLELTPSNAGQFYTLHPRCGTSFLMFVMVIAILLFSLFGWPNVWMRLLSRLLMIPVIAGLSYELLKWAGRSDNIVVKILSMPGLWLQKLTTAEPTDKQLEVAICAMKAVLVPSDTPCIEGICDLDANIIEDDLKMNDEPDIEFETIERNDDDGITG